MYNLKSFALPVLIASVWIVNGLVCKVLGFVPRHKQIVSVILGESHASTLITIIGISEILLGFWVLSGHKSQICWRFQVILILGMNIIEFMIVPHLLLWGHFNLVFAMAFSGLVYLSGSTTNKTNKLNVC